MKNSTAMQLNKYCQNRKKISEILCKFRIHDYFLDVATYVYSFVLVCANFKIFMSKILRLPTFYVDTLIFKQSTDTKIKLVSKLFTKL